MNTYLRSSPACFHWLSMIPMICSVSISWRRSVRREEGGGRREEGGGRRKGGKREEGERRREGQLDVGEERTVNAN